MLDGHFWTTLLVIILERILVVYVAWDIDVENEI